MKTASHTTASSPYSESTPGSAAFAHLIIMTKFQSSFSIIPQNGYN